jgi:hypothetical protein
MRTITSPFFVYMSSIGIRLLVDDYVSHGYFFAFFYTFMFSFKNERNAA